MVENLDLSSYNVILKVARQNELSPEELSRMMGYKSKIATIESNISKGLYNPFEGLSLQDKKDLLSYLVFSRENAFTNPGKGDTLVVDSAAKLLRDPNVYSDVTKDLDYDIVVCLNRQKGLISVTLDIDSHGVPIIVKDHNK